MTKKEADPGDESRQASRRPPGQEDATCDTACEPASGPVREAGGTTGAGNLSPGQASRTGGATSGVNPDQVARPPQRRDVPPSA